jgi:hypothetical protein
LSTSSSYDHSVSATQIITDALLKCGGASDGEDIPSEQMKSALWQLNNLIKFISAKGRCLLLTPLRILSVVEFYSTTIQAI